METINKKGGFYDLPQQKTCNYPNHNPPTNIYIPPGKGYRHVCPKCGEVKDLVPLQITL